MSDEASVEVEQQTAGPGAVPDAGPAPRRGVLGTLSDQLGLRHLVSDYLIPVESNSVWYALGGVLAIALVLEIVSGALLALVYRPDAGAAYGISQHLLQTPGWSFVLNFHYFNAFLIFGLVMVHMLRVFISGGYRRGKQGLWIIGVGLAGLTFLVSLTGEALHWDEAGFAVPWHISEFFQAIGLAGPLGYTFSALRSIPTATEKLSQIYALHIAIVPVTLVAFIGWHYLLIRFKGISVPFWLKRSGRVAAFSEHIKAWLAWSALILGVVVLISLFVPRDAGIAPQLLPTSPFFGSAHGPGALGIKPTFPISWTHGMNVFFSSHLGIEPDIWGTFVGMVLMLGALLVIPFVDRGDTEPDSTAAAFNLRKRGWAFLAMGIFWLVLIVGVVQNAIASAG